LLEFAIQSDSEIDIGQCTPYRRRAPPISPINQNEPMQTWKTIEGILTGGNPEPGRRVEKTELEWRELLTEEQFQITRLKATERPFSSEMCQLFQPGEYQCICCSTPLFDSGEKFDSGSGWPSFTQAITPAAIAYHGDATHGMSRVEVTCNTCGAHLGHVFPDGPAPSGLRYCINAISIEKSASESAEKQGD